MALGSEKQESFRKRKRHRFSLPKKVEVKSEEEGFLGSWHPGTVNACYQRGWIVIYNVNYDHMLSDDGFNIIDQIEVCLCKEDTCTVSEKQRIRPSPPSIVFGKWDLPYGICVDVYDRDCWWEGVIFDHEDGSHQRKVFFPDLGDEMISNIDLVRIAQDWNEVTQTWQQCGTWVFLELIEEYEEEIFLPVSVKQLWYDLREKEEFQKLGGWNSHKKALLRQLMLEAIGENFQLVIGNLFDKGCCCDEADQQLKSAELVHESHMNLGTYLAETHVKVQIDNNAYNDAANRAICSLPHNLSTMSSNLDGVHVTGAGINVDQCLASNAENNNHKQLSLPHRVVWLPAGADIVSGAESCPEAVVEYAQRHTKRNRGLVQQDVKKHLLHLKWTIDFMRDKNRVRLRFTSPQGKHFYSLLEVCKHLISGNVENVSSISHDEKSSLLSSGSGSGSFSFHIKKPSGSKESNSVSLADFDASDSDILTVKSKYDNQAVANRYNVRLLRGLHKGMKSREREKKCMMKSSTLLGRYAKRYKFHARGIKKFQRTHFLQTKDCLSSQNSRLSIMKYRNCRDFIKPKNKKPNSGQRLMLQSSEKVREIKTSDPSHHIPRTLLSWLIENNVVLPRAKVHYRTKEGLKPFKEGRITRGGIECACCHEVLTLRRFEAHAGSKTECPSAKIFLNNGISLSNCLMKIIHDRKSTFITRQPDRWKGGRCQNQNDNVCSVCRFGGELVLCDRCPSSFHNKCLGMKDIPAGDWFCPACRCRICGQSKLTKSAGDCLDDSVLSCCQCEHKFHIGCLKNRRENKLEHDPKADWFCSKKCELIFLGLHELLGKPIPVGDNLTWTLLKPMHSDGEVLDIEVFAENYSKLHIALDVMHECFDPVEEPQTRRDIVRDVIFSEGSDLKRLNFRGFYTVLLEKNDEIITVASLRVYGEKTAEIPLVGTSFQYRRRGMCRILMNVLEEKLINLGVQRLILPSAPDVLNTWTGSFGFSKMSDAERLEFLDYTFLEFQGTIMCHKPLTVIPCAELSPSKEIMLVVSEDVDKSCGFIGFCGSNFDALQVDPVDEGKIMEEEQANDSSAGKNSNGREGVANLAKKTYDSTLKNESRNGANGLTADKKRNYGENGTFKYYQRRKTANRGAMRSLGYIKDFQGCIS